MEQIFLSLNREQLQAILHSSVKEVLSELKLESAKKYFTRKELCDQFGISLPTLDGLIRTGKVKSYKIGSRILFKVDEIDSFLESQRYI